MLSKFDTVKINLDNIVFVLHYQIHSEKIKIITQEKTFNFDISIFNKAHLSKILVRPINTEVQRILGEQKEVLKNKKIETNYYKRLFQSKKYVDLGTKALAIFALIAAALLIIFDNNLTGRMFVTSASLLLSFIFSGFIRHYMEDFLEDKDYDRYY